MRKPGSSPRRRPGALRPNDVHSKIVCTGTTAKILARRGELEAAERLAREAVEFAEAGDFLHSHAGALTDLSEVLELGGHRDGAVEALHRAIELHERKGNVLAVAHARACLHELS